MKLIKQFTCLVVCIVLLSSSFIVGYAAEDVLFTAEDLIDFGFEYQPDEYIYTYSGDEDPFGDFNYFVTSEKNYPDFNPVTDVPWSTFPQYIKDIMYMNTDDLTAAVGESFKVPFVVLFVENSVVNVFAGINIGIGQLNNSYLSFSIFSVLTNAEISSHSVLYRFSYNYKTDKVNVNWTETTPESFGDRGNLKRMISWNIGSDSSVFDVYGYGANGVQYPSKVTSISVNYNSTNTNNLCGFYTRKNGFQSGEFLHGQVNAYPYIYFSYFVPPSQESINQQLQEEQNETSKGILGTLKEIPDKIQSFFETLKNYLLYFQETEPEHVNPFSGILDGISSFFDEQIGDTEEFKSSLNTTFDNVSGYIETGSNIINKLLGGVPILNTVLIFFLAFAVIRKVVGR